MRWFELLQEAAGETPAHWSCIKCGTVVWPDQVKEISKNSLETKESVCGLDETLSEMKGEIMGQKKKCSRCGQVKDIDEFSVNKSNPDGHEYKCKVCWKDIRAEKSKDKKVGGDGRRKRSRPVAPDPGNEPVAESLYMDPAAIRSIKRSVGKEILSEFSKYLEERYA